MRKMRHIKISQCLKFGQFQLFLYLTNKKVLRERKRHTARHDGGTPPGKDMGPVDVLWDGEGAGGKKLKWWYSYLHNCYRRKSAALSGLSNAQLAEHYANCIKLSAENVRVKSF